MTRRIVTSYHYELNVINVEEINIIENICKKTKKNLRSCENYCNMSNENIEKLIMKTKTHGDFVVWKSRIINTMLIRNCNGKTSKCGTNWVL